jgi:uncharacterized protein with PIN domain
MRSATLRFHGRLTDFVAGREVRIEFELPAGVRDLIQRVGVPHVEVGSITVDGKMVHFDFTVDDGAIIEVHDRFEGAGSRLHPARAPHRFVLDVHLGRLAGYLRLLGFDSLHRIDYDDDTLVTISLNESRTLLTRDRPLLMRAALENGVYVRSQNPRQQLREVVERLGLQPSIAPFERCIACNELLVAVSRDDVSDRLPTSVRTRHERFTLCPGCRRVYWPGSHYDRLVEIIEYARTDAPDGAQT